MQIGELGLELDVIMGGAGDVARAAGAGADRLDRLMHGGAHGRVLAHAEIVVGAPYRHVAGALAGELIGGRVSAAAALQLGKDPVAAFLVQRLEALTKIRVVVHHSQPALLGDPALLNHTRPRKYSAWVPLFTCQSVAPGGEIAQKPSKLTPFRLSRRSGLPTNVFFTGAKPERKQNGGRGEKPISVVQAVKAGNEHFLDLSQIGSPAPRSHDQVGH